MPSDKPVYHGDHPANISASLREIAARQLSERDRDYLLRAADSVYRLAESARLAVPLTFQPTPRRSRNEHTY